MKLHYTNFRWWRDGSPQHMVVEDGRVLFRGTEQSTIVPDSELLDLDGKTLYPSFIDNHCHILPTGLDLQKLHLGSCTTNEEVLDAVRDRLYSIPPGQWLHAVHYDQTKFGGVYLTRKELDSISQTTPILLRHVNGHASVANSAALAAAGIADDETDPNGGSFGRGEDGKVNGVLYESAHEQVSHRAPNPTLDEMVDAILLASDRMADLGICCASDMMTGRFDLVQELEAYRIASERGAKIISRLYLQWGEVFKKDGDWRSPEIAALIGAFGNPSTRIGGIKIFADGAIGSATAAIYGRYSGAPASGFLVRRHARRATDHAPEGRDVSGQLIYAPDRLNQMVRVAHDAGFQLAIHTIGDYSTDLVMDAYESLGDCRRHRIEHAMILSDDQIQRMAALGCHCTMQPEFLIRFGHSYERQLGRERMSRMERFRSVLDAGIPLSFSSDRPIVAGDPRDGVAVATRRPEGFDPSENVSRDEAIIAYTTWAASANLDSELLGGLEEGQLALFRLD